MKSRTTEIFRQIKKIIHEIDSNAAVILFGSRARGDEKPGSDWDILVLTSRATSPQIEKHCRHQLYMLELEIEEPISLFIYSREEWENVQRITPFYAEVLKEGVVQ
jgi:predicted nucleotidyltransferase